jgi:hypothetical protein
MVRRHNDEATLDELRAELQAVATRLDGFEQQCSREVRTERVVVVDADGIERVVLSGQLQTGSVLVRVPGAEDLISGTEVYASHDVDGGEPLTGVVIWQDGNQVAFWTNQSMSHPPLGPEGEDN